MKNHHPVSNLYFYFIALFVDPAKENLYIYYSNTRDEAQNYKLTQGMLKNIYGVTATGVIYGSPSNHCIDAQQLYSRSGKGGVFDINVYYNATCDDLGADSTQRHPFEIRNTVVYDTLNPSGDVADCGTLPGGAVCLVVPAVSCGYIKIPIAESDGSGKMNISESKYKIYPNPAYNYFTIDETSSSGYTTGELFIQILKPDGSIQMQITTRLAHDINIMHLPPGMYLIHIQNNTGNSSVKKLIKMQ